MAAEEVEGIVLARHRFSETSWTLRAFTREHGRLDLVAKGARRPKSPMYGRLDLFNRESMTVYPSRRDGLDLLASSYVFDEHLGLRRKTAAFAAAGMLAEAARFAFLTRDPHPGVYAALARALAELSAWGAGPRRPAPSSADSTATTPPPDPSAIAAAALLTFLADAGYTPRLAGCVVCGRDGATTGAAGAAAMALSVARGGLVCAKCRRRGDILLAPRDSPLLRRITAGDVSAQSSPVAAAVVGVSPMAAAALAEFLSRSVGRAASPAARVWRALMPNSEC